MKAVAFTEMHSLVIEPSVRVSVLAEFLGYQYRPSGWRAVEREVGPTSHVLYLIDHGTITLLEEAGKSGETFGSGDLVAVGPRRRAGLAFSAGCGFHEIWFRVFRDDEAIVATEPTVSRRGLSEMRRVFEDAVQAILWRGAGESVGALERHWLGLLLAHLHADPAAREQSGGLGARRRARLLRWVGQHLHENPGPAELAAVVRLSPDYFSRVFRESFGVSPRQWLLTERLRVAARRLLETDQPIYRVAQEVGCPDAALFSRQFRSEYGVSPRAYRRRHGPSPRVDRNA